MLRIISANLNGIRSAWNKGFGDWLDLQRADVVGVQELKAHKSDLRPEMLEPAGRHAYYCCAQKKGYSGVGLLCRSKPDKVIHGFASSEFDDEGRYIQADFGKLSVISLYLPSGSSSEERQQAKFRCLDEFLPRLAALRKGGREVVVCGDWNIAHRENDLKNWKSNQKNSGFLPEERSWMDELLGAAGYVDAFREVTEAPDQYTWWSNRGQAWAKNVGWRIDYQIVSRGLAGAARSVSIHKSSRFSDHAPLTIDYAL